MIILKIYSDVDAEIARAGFVVPVIVAWVDFAEGFGVVAEVGESEIIGEFEIEEVDGEATAHAKTSVETLEAIGIGVELLTVAHIVTFDLSS